MPLCSVLRTSVRFSSITSCGAHNNSLATGLLGPAAALLAVPEIVSGKQISAAIPSSYPRAASSYLEFSPRTSSASLINVEAKLDRASYRQCLSFGPKIHPEFLFQKKLTFDKRLRHFRLAESQLQIIGDLRWYRSTTTSVKHSRGWSHKLSSLVGASFTAQHHKIYNLPAGLLRSTSSDYFPKETALLMVCRGYPNLARLFVTPG